MPQNSQHPQYGAMLARWQRCRDAFEGEDAVKAKREIYLPRLSKQEDDDYKAYLMRASFFGATERTVMGLTGAAINKPFECELPSSINYIEEDATLDGNCLDEVIKWEVSELLLEGRIGILVDRDPNGVDPPYLVQYSAEQIINWTEVNGELTRVILEEKTYVQDPKDSYSLTAIVRWRELALEDKTYKVRIHTKNKDEASKFDTVESIPTMRGAALDYIPFVFGNAHGIGCDIHKPPLMALVDVNLSHYRNSADLEHGRHYTGLPTPWVAGGKVEGDLRIGSQAAWLFDDWQTKVGFLEFTGQGLQALEKALETKEQQMSVLGARLLEQSKAGVEAADTVRMRQMGDVFTLASINEAAADVLELALSYADKWQGGTGDGIEVTPNTDFLDEELPAAEITALVAAWVAGAISLETLLWNLKRGDRMNTEVEDELAAIDKEKAAAPATLPVLTAEERAQLGLKPTPAPAPVKK